MLIITIVEDHFITAYEIQTLLEKEGYTSVSIKAYGKEAIEEAQKHSHCKALLFIMDIGLRGTMDGLETIEAIKNIKPNAHFIVISGEEERLKYAASIHKYTLPKPISNGELTTMVKTILF